MSDYQTPIRGLLPDHEIRRLSLNHKMIDPITITKSSINSPSHGMSSYGYDITLGCTFKMPKERRGMFQPDEISYPGKVQELDYETLVLVDTRGAFILRPGEFCLAESIESFDMPMNVLGLVKDKSTYARLGIGVFNTVIEPGWKGILTLEIVNNSPKSVALYAKRGIAQVLFYGNEPCETPYGDGKYQNAKSLEIPK